MIRLLTFASHGASYFHFSRFVSAPVFIHRSSIAVAITTNDIFVAFEMPLLSLRMGKQQKCLLVAVSMSFTRIWLAAVLKYIFNGYEQSSDEENVLMQLQNKKHATWFYLEQVKEVLFPKMTYCKDFLDNGESDLQEQDEAATEISLDKATGQELLSDYVVDELWQVFIADSITQPVGEQQESVLWLEESIHEERQETTQEAACDEIAANDVVDISEEYVQWIGEENIASPDFEEQQEAMLEAVCDEVTDNDVADISVGCVQWGDEENIASPDFEEQQEVMLEAVCDEVADNDVEDISVGCVQWDDEENIASPDFEGQQEAMLEAVCDEVADNDVADISVGCVQWGDEENIASSDFEGLQEAILEVACDEIVDNDTASILDEGEEGEGIFQVGQAAGEVYEVQAISEELFQEGQESTSIVCSREDMPKGNCSDDGEDQWASGLVFKYDDESNLAHRESNKRSFG
ncbi:MAG: hypothetical protein K0S08_1787 [Gammaproteobacteria bacterium]|jgi:hypothetical protein|nr:hypothetical protein [Gammaproteobacteria bacterium]